MDWSGYIGTADVTTTL